MTETIQLRVAGDDDAAALTKLFVTVQSALSPATSQSPEATAYWFCEMLLPEADITIAELKGVLVGFTAVRDGFLQQLCVDPNHRDKTVGSQLIEAAQNAHPEGLFVEVREEAPRAIAWLERFGFVSLDQQGAVRTPGAMRAMRWRPSD